MLRNPLLRSGNSLGGFRLAVGTAAHPVLARRDRQGRVLAHGSVVFCRRPTAVHVTWFRLMRTLRPQAAYVVRHPGAFTVRVLRAFRSNQRLLLAGAVAYYTLLSPVGRPSWRHALIGGITAAVLWEITRDALVWYFGTLSQVNLVYGSLTTSIVVLLSLEIAATLLLFGAQVIAEYERIGTKGQDAAPRFLRT